MNRNLHSQFWILSAIIFANFVAQVFYFLHLYYTPQHPFPDFKSTLALGSVLILFLLGVLLFVNRKRIGAYLLTGFLTIEFLFYLWNILGAALHGLGWFFHLSEPDPLLWSVFAIGYLNFFASGYFLFLLLTNARQQKFFSA